MNRTTRNILGVLFVLVLIWTNPSTTKFIEFLSERNNKYSGHKMNSAERMSGKTNLIFFTVFTSSLNTPMLEKLLGGENSPRTKTTYLGIFGTFIKL